MAQIRLPVSASERLLFEKQNPEPMDGLIELALSEPGYARLGTVSL